MIKSSFLLNSCAFDCYLCLPEPRTNINLSMNFRPYHPKQDKSAVHRIWKEIRGITQVQEVDYFLSDCQVLVADIRGEAECLVASAQGEFQYLEEQLRLSAIMEVATSRIARKQGLASSLTAELIARNAANGAQIAALSMFEQGFYDRLGFGTGGYDHMLSFDPADLTVKDSFRVPKRLTIDDWEDMYRAATLRHRSHGGCVIEGASIFRAELAWANKGYGLGYSDGAEGSLSHYFWASSEDGYGPCFIRILVYQNHDQLKELLALLKSMGDEIQLVTLLEPPEIQLQDLIKQPFRGMSISRRSSYEQNNHAKAVWQVRICDLPGCLEKTHMLGTPISFNLSLYDPIEESLPITAPWRGISGEYTISLGPESHAVAGTSASLPTLTASVGAFSRLWLGVRPASGLAVTDQLNGPEELLQQLDRLLVLPKAYLGWDF